MLPSLQVVGDLHGQFFDLLQLLNVGGWPPETSYIFLGDFVDRGHNSVETLSLLLCLKLKYPGHVTLLRGNHEVRLEFNVAQSHLPLFSNPPYMAIRVAKLRKSMAFMMSVCENMEMHLLGDIV